MNKVSIPNLNFPRLNAMRIAAKMYLIPAGSSTWGGMLDEQYNDGGDIERWKKYQAEFETQLAKEAKNG